MLSAASGTVEDHEARQDVLLSSPQTLAAPSPPFHSRHKCQPSRRGYGGPRLRTHVVSESATVLCKALSRYRLHSRCGASGPREHPLRPTGSTCRPSPAGLAEKPLCREKAPCAGAQACGLQTGLSHSRTRRARSPFNHMRPVGDLLRPRPETGR